jgi:hypothetical protein
MLGAGFRNDSGYAISELRLKCILDSKVASKNDLFYGRSATLLAKAAANFRKRKGKKPKEPHTGRGNLKQAMKTVWALTRNPAIELSASWRANHACFRPEWTLQFGCEVGWQAAAPFCTLKRV